MQPKVKSITTLVDERGGRVSWGNNDIIAYGGFGEDHLYDLWTARPDGSDVKCLTSGNPKIAQLQNGQPTWHPSGKYIVFQSQDPNLPQSQVINYALADPAMGMNSNLWATDPEGETFYQLTYVKENQTSLHSHFSHDGKKLIWSSNMNMMIADFRETPEPHLENIRVCPTGDVWPETHSFSPDNSKVLYTAFFPVGIGSEYDRSSAQDPIHDLVQGKFRLATDGIWEMDLPTHETKKITGDPDSWDEHAHYSPDGKKIVWASSRGLKYDGQSMEEVFASTMLDYWIMDANGSNQERLTYFNEPDHQHYLGGDHPVTAVDFSWSPDGKRIVACLLRGVAKALASVVIIELVDN
jgi:Tol biopolymer transport system component